MSRTLMLLVAGAALVFPTLSGGVHRPIDKRARAAGKWSVKFANGVTEVCEIRKDGTASVVEPQRTSSGRVAVQGSSFVIVFADDRTECWTPAGKRFFVEHWFPAAQMPTATPVFGIAERVQ